MSITINSFDVFLSHANEDKETLAFPLADFLRSIGVSVWYDSFQLEVGDSLSRKIDHGLSNSNYGIVIISPAFLAKHWPEYELRALVTKEIGERKVILPVWHNVTREEVLKYSPSLADKFALIAGDSSISELAHSLVRVIRPDIHQSFQRALLRRAIRLEGLQRVPLSKIRSSPPKHPTLPQELITRIIIIHAMTKDVLSMSLAQSVYSFRCDATPETEVRVWERIAACYFLATYKKSLSKRQKVDIFRIYLFASMTPLDKQDRKFIKSFTSRQVDEYLALYDSNLSQTDFTQSQV